MATRHGRRREEGGVGWLLVENSSVAYKQNEQQTRRSALGRASGIQYAVTKLEQVLREEHGVRISTVEIFASVPMAC